MKTTNEERLPAAREEEMIVQEMGEEVLVYDQRRHRAHCLNETAALVWRALDGKRTAAQVAARVRQERGVEMNEAVVELAVEELRRGGLVEEKWRKRSGMSRRMNAQFTAWR